MEGLYHPVAGSHVAWAELASNENHDVTVTGIGEIPDASR